MTQVGVGDRVQVVGAHPWAGHSGDVEHVSALDGGITVLLDCGLRATVADPKYWVPLAGDEEDRCDCGECDTCVQRILEAQADFAADLYMKRGGRTMKFCQEHWDKLRAAIDARGLTPLVARNGREAMERTVEELEGTEAEATLDPLMSAHWMISSHALQGGGLYLLSGEYCPVCEFCKHADPPPAGHRYATNEAYMIDGPADAVLASVRGSPVLCALLGWEPST